jgi:hypothetical protein
MMSLVRKRLTYANVVATLALFLALGGVGYAAIKLPKNSVGTKQLKNGAVTGKKIAPAAKKELGGAGGIGSQGPAGPTGSPGLTGAPGEPGSALAYARVDADGTLITAHSKNVAGVVLACEANEPAECPQPQTEFPNSTPNPEYCFKLSFEPNVVSVTPETGVIYNHTTPTFDADIPGRTYSALRGGCPPGFRSAEVRLNFESAYEAHFGFFVVFN